MHNINITPALDYCRKGNNLLDASVHFKVNSTNAQYTSAPTVTFSGGSGITAATGHAILVDGRVTEVVVDTPGSGYSTAPTISFSGGGGAGATATATISGGAVNGTTVTASGGKTITFTDNTAYDTAGGESRATVHIDLYDRFSYHKEYEIAAADVDNAITVDLGGFNTVEGLEAQVLVVSNLDNKKDGSVYDLVLIRQEGDFVIEI